MRNVSIRLRAFLTAILLFVLLPVFVEPCTIAVVSGRVTVDGRPLLWKNRDITDQNNLMRYFAGEEYSYIGITKAGEHDRVWAGINSAGFAIVNSVSYDLEGEGSSNNGGFMKTALSCCGSVHEFELLLQTTNISGRSTLANFGVIDAFGQAAIFESGNSSYTRYDADKAPYGFVCRSNFAFTGVNPDLGHGFERYERAKELLTYAAAAGSLDHKYILRQIARDLVNKEVDPYPLPYEGTQNNHAPGYIYTYYSINRYRTASCSVFQGVKPGEDPSLAVMWVILGEPICSIALPLWVASGSVPFVMEGNYTSPFRDAVKAVEQKCYTDSGSERYIDTYALVNPEGTGILAHIFPLENELFSQTELVLANWRTAIPAASEILIFQQNLAKWAFIKYIKKKKIVYNR